MKKKLLFIVPVVAMAMAGCAKNGGGSSSSTVDPTTSAQPTSGTVDPTTSEQPTTSGTSGETSGTTSTPTSGTTSETPTTSSSTSETPVVVKVTKISLAKYSETLNIGDFAQITATITPDNATDKGLVYASDDPTVATVDENGVITGVGAGTTVIHVTPHDDPTATASDLHKTINVSVNDPSFVVPQQTSDGYSILGVSDHLQNGDSVYFTAYYGQKPYFGGVRVTEKGTEAMGAYLGSIAENKAAAPEQAEKYTVVESGEYFAFKNSDNKYFAAKGSGNGSALESEISDKSKFTVSVDDKGAATIVAACSSYNHVRYNYNGGTPFFRCYGESSSVDTKPVIYFKAAVRLDHIEVTSEPTKTKYVEGESFVKEGMTVKAVYSDGTETANVDYTVAEEGPLAAGTSEVHISYEGKEVTQAIEVHAKTLSSIVITSAPSKAYNIGDSVTKDDLVVKALYNVGDTGFEREDDNFKDYTISPESFTVPGDDVEVTIAAVADSSKTASFNVKVNDYELLEIEIKSNPTKLAYYDGDTLDPTGLVITATYSGGEPKDIAYDASSFTLSPAAGSVLHADAEAQTVTVTYGGKTTSFNINVDELEIVSFSIKSNPTKTDYMVGETLDLTGLVVEATYNSGAKDSDFKGYTVNPAEGYEFTAGDIGTKAITVEIDGIGSETFSVNVEAKNGIKKAYELANALPNKDGVTAEVSFSGYISGFVGNAPIVQDGAYAIYVYANAPIANAVLGAKMDVTATLTKYNGWIETKAVSKKVVDIEAAPVIQGAIPVDSLAKLASLNQNVCIDVSNITVTQTMKTWSSSTTLNAKADLGGEEVTLSFQKGAFNDAMNDKIKALQVGDVFSLNSVAVSNYNGTNQILVTSNAVFVSEHVRVQALSLNKFATSLVVGDTDTLIPVVLPEIATVKAVSWNSDHPEIATVSDDGVITAVAAGSAVITARTTDGTNIPATCNVTVTSGVVHVTSVELDQHTLAVETNAEPITLTATVLPDDATTKDLTWTSSDESVATVANGVVTIKGAGEVTITATSVDDSSKSDACVITVTEHHTSGLIEEGKYYINTQKDDGSVTYYLKSNGTESAPSAVTDINEATLFNFNLVDDNTYQIVTDDGDALYCTSANNGVRVQPLDKVITGSTWEVSEKSLSSAPGDYTFKHIGTSRFLALYNNADFRCYTDATASNRKADTGVTKPAEPTPVSGVSLDKEFLTMNVGGADETLTANVLPADATNKNVTWAASPEGVVTVENGVVHAVAAGNATITVTTEEGGYTATCAVAVAAAKVVDSIAVKTAPSKVEYKAGDNFDPTGLVITVNYSDETSADITYSESNKELFSFTPSENLQTSDTEVTITYGGKTCTQAITVSDAPATKTYTASITLASLGLSSSSGYKEGDATITASASDSSTKTFTVHFVGVCKNNDNMQMRSTKNSVIYNTSSCATISGITVSGGTMNVFYGDSQEPTGTTVGGSYFKINNADTSIQYISEIIITFVA